MRHTSITIEGFLVGNIWMPAAECFKHLTFDVDSHRSRCVSSDGSRYTLRDAMLEATRDGDFQSCVVAAGTLRIEVTTITEGRRVSRSRSWPLDRFPSIRDMLHADPEWFPAYDEEEA